MDIAAKPECSSLILFVSCKGSTAYEMEFLHGSFQTTEIRSKECGQEGLRYHHIYVYPCGPSYSIHCSCEGVLKCCTLCTPSSLLHFELNKSNQFYLVDGEGNQYRIDIRDQIDDMTAFYVVDRALLPQVVLVCRSGNYINVYTDILQYYHSPH